MARSRNAFEKRLSELGYQGLHASGVDMLQVNVGLRCNQHCLHCHLACSPAHAETMEWPVMKLILSVTRRIRPALVDLTGGAPELNPHLRRFVAALCDQGQTVQVRTNLTGLLESGMEQWPEFFRQHGVGLVASLPCYLEKNVDFQRGPRTFHKSVEAIRRLNAVGYGTAPNLPLHLVYNPGGPYLPPEQSALESDYRSQLSLRFGIAFTHLLTITNMPIGRFLARLRRDHQLGKYLSLLRHSFNPETVERLMCRRQINIAWDGTLYDCDFNLGLRMPVDHGAANHIHRFDAGVLAKRRVVTGNHCFGCTAGRGSSCGGALAS